MSNRHWIHFYLARLCRLLRLHGAAAAQYRRAFAANAGFALAPASLGVLMASRGRYTEAVGAFHEALAVDPQNAETWFNLGYVQQRQEDFDGAIQSFRRAVKIDAALDRAWFGMGLIHRARNEPAKAVEVLKKAAALQPKNVYVLHELGMAYFALNNLDQVRKTIRQISEFDARRSRALMRETGQLAEGEQRP